MQSSDDPIDEMIAALATQHENPVEALFAALNTLEDRGGYIILPTGGGSGWRPDLRILRRRALRRQKRKSVKGSMQI